MNCTTTKVVIGRITATKLGISRPVSSTKTTSERPWFTTSSTNRSDWISQTSAVSPPVTAISAKASWRKM